MKYASIFTMVMLMTFTAPAFAAAPSSKETIVAVVNKGVITESDVKARMDLIAVSSGLKPSKELDEKLRPQIVDMLIDEQIRSQEAERLNLKIDPKEVDSGFEQIAKQNNIPADVFKKALEERGIKVNTMRDQIRTQIAWTKVVQKRVRSKIEITDADIDSELDRMKENIGKDQYNIAEIYLPVTDPTKLSQAKTFAAKLAEQLRAEPDAFSKAARQFSQSPGANQGKSIGWVMQGVLAKEVDAVLPTLEKGTISSPIETSTGLYIIKLQDKRQLAADQLPSREDITEKLGMERMDRAQRRYYQDLRAQAFIEKRG